MVARCVYWGAVMWLALFSFLLIGGDALWM